MSEKSNFMFPKEGSAVAKWKVSFFISLIVLIFAGSCFALTEDNLAADSPWASFFNNRTEKVVPETGILVVEENVDQGSKLTYNGKLVAKVQYPTGAYSEYRYDNEERVSVQSLYDETGKLVVVSYFTYTGSETIINTGDAQSIKRQIKLTLNQGKVIAKEVFDLAFSNYQPVEKWQLRDNTLEIVTRQQYLAPTDAYFETTDWDQLLLAFYAPSPTPIKEQQSQVSFNGNIASIIYTDSLKEQALEKEFDGLGRLRKLATEDTVATFEYNWLGLLSQLTIKVGDKVESYQYKYDALGRQIFDPQARRFEVTYTYYQDKLQQIQSANGVITYKYNQDGLPVAREDSFGKRTEFAFDLQKLVLAASYEDGSSVLVQYTANGRRSLMKDASGETGYEYNEFGQLTKLTKNISGESFTLVHEYSPAGWLAKVTTPDGKQTEISAKENILAQAKRFTSEPIWPWFN